jgi:hypothetical protein
MPPSGTMIDLMCARVSGGICGDVISDAFDAPDRQALKPGRAPHARKPVRLVERFCGARACFAERTSRQQSGRLKT